MVVLSPLLGRYQVPNTVMVNFQSREDTGPEIAFKVTMARCRVPYIHLLSAPSEDGTEIAPAMILQTDINLDE